MEFGKVVDINSVDFTLPPDPPQTAQLLQRYKTQQPVQFYVGCPEWSNKGWLGTFYPAQTKSNAFLAYYAQQFNCIELNSTHYSLPAPETVSKWGEDTPSHFQFCPKIPQTISHYQLFSAQGLTLSHEFQTSMNKLQQQSGIRFLQLPPTLSAHQVNSLLQYLQQTPIKPLAIEFRHPSWFEHGYFEHMAAWLEYLGVTTVITDVAGRRDVLHQRLTTPVAFVRFVGNRLHDTDYQRVDAWIQRLKIWIQQGLQQVYFFVHQPQHNLLSPQFSVYVTQQFNEVLGANLHVPLIHTQPTQTGLF